MFVFNEDTAIEDLGNGVKRKVLAHGGNMMAVEVHFIKGLSTLYITTNMNS